MHLILWLALGLFLGPAVFDLEFVPRLNLISQIAGGAFLFPFAFGLACFSGNLFMSVAMLAANYAFQAKLISGAEFSGLVFVGVLTSLMAWSFVHSKLSINEDTR